jgi:adenine-specific DNA-methyltransferase
MNSKYKKLELCWPGKDIEVKPEPRVFIEDPEKSYGESDTENMLIHADNLLALKALEQNFAGQIKCIYIDPPYNTGNAFEHYDDGLEHSVWLNLLKPRLEILYKLLSVDGSIWISIDDDESHYLKVFCDELFGRKNYVASCIWQKIHSTKNDAKYLSQNHEYILVYAKSIDDLKINLLERTDAMNSRYKNPDKDPRGPWQSGDLVANEERKNGYYDVFSPSGKSFNVPQGKHWVYAQDTMEKMISENRIWFGKDGNAFPRKKRFLSEVQQGRKGDTWWSSNEVGHNQEAKREVKALNSEDIFATPKPERLIERIIQLATNTGDWVLDSFLGSGTTVSVAHKMKRKYIGIELGEHCNTHCLPRLKAVCDGTDQGGISKSTKWKGGGGFKFYNLAPSLLNKDKYNQWVINPNYNAQLLAASMARQEGFTYKPNEEVIWKQGYATENHFIFTTTNTITPDIVEQILSELKPEESLRICCVAFKEGCNDISTRIEIKKIPDMILGKCEFGKEDYCTESNIINMPIDPDSPAFVPSYVKSDVKPEPAKIKKDSQTQLLF